MADTKVSALTDIGAGLSSDDLIYVVNDPGGTPASRKATIAELEAQIIADGRDFTLVRAASDQDVASNVTVANDAELFFTMAANTLYQFEYMIMYSSPVGAGTPDFKMTFNGPATLTGSYMYDSACITTADGQLAAQAGVALAATGSLGTAATPRLVTGRGWAYSTTGGSGSSGLVLQWAQVTSGANVTRRHAGSRLRWRIIS